MKTGVSLRKYRSVKNVLSASLHLSRQRSPEAAVSNFSRLFLLELPPAPLASIHALVSFYVCLLRFLSLFLSLSPFIVFHTLLFIFLAIEAVKQIKAQTHVLNT